MWRIREHSKRCALSTYCQLEKTCISIKFWLKQTELLTSWCIRLHLPSKHLHFDCLIALTFIKWTQVKNRDILNWILKFCDSLVKMFESKHLQIELKGGRVNFIFRAQYPKLQVCLKMLYNVYSIRPSLSSDPPFRYGKTPQKKL